MLVGVGRLFQTAALRQEKSVGCSDPAVGMEAAGTDLECPSGAQRAMTWPE